MDGFKKYTNYKTVLSVNALIYCKNKVLLLKRASDKKGRLIRKSITVL